MRQGILFSSNYLFFILFLLFFIIFPSCNCSQPEKGHDVSWIDDSKNVAIPPVVNLMNFSNLRTSVSHFCEKVFFFVYLELGFFFS